MPQHDMIIANANFPTLRADVNDALAALVANSSGATAPATTYSYQWWADTTTGLLKIRNAANSAWLIVCDLATGAPVLGAGAALVFEGTTDDAFETTLTVVDPTADRAIALPNQSGTLALLSDIGSARGSFYKADPTTVAFTKTGAGTAEIKAGTIIDVAGTTVTFSGATSITMPTLTAGTDYAIWLKSDATIQATTDFVSAPGAGNWRKIGGFHYAPGGNATGVAGGDTTAAINAYSLWDLKFRPACPDPRGMTLVADSFWSDIYLCGVDHLTNGTSKYNVTIADGSSPPKIPTKFGGNGSTAYSTLNWWEAAEVMQSWGKRLPTYDEFAAMAYGTTEAQSSEGSDVPTTGVNGTGYTNTWNEFTSKWGAIQSTGCLYVWGAEFGGGAASAAWTANTGGRGSTYQMESAALFGGYWGNTSSSGSRASGWSNSPTASSGSIGVRGVCDHMILD
jgi:hypothetical protein